MINIILNGQSLALRQETPLTEFLAQHATDSEYALAINESFLPRTQYNGITVRDGDRIELLSPMQGG